MSYASSYVINPGGESGADPGDNTGGGNGYQEQVVSSWREILKVNPILEDYVAWGQDEPFNDLCPERRYYLVAGKSRKAPAGCFPLAIAKIMTHFEVPSIYTFNGYTIDWDSLKESGYPDSDVANSSAATLLYAISSGCNSLYFYEGTFTFPMMAESYMESVQFTNVNRVDYSFDAVTGMVRNGKPLIIYAIPANLRLYDSHSWNIDGYKVKQRTITTNTYVDNILQDSSSTIETCRMVHCDFGFEGCCNGYYVSGVFKLDDSSIDHDSSNYSGSTNYNQYVHLITYDLP